MKNSVKSTLSVIICVLAMIGVSAYFLFSGYTELTGDHKTVTLYYAKDILEVEHTINGLIPTGSDYYYVGVDEDYNFYVIQAGKNWLTDNFNSDGEAKSSGYVLTAPTKDISDYDVKKSLNGSLSDLSADFPMGLSTCLFERYKADAYEKFAAVLFGLVAVIGFAVSIKKKDNAVDEWGYEDTSSKKKMGIVGIVATVFLFISLALTIHIL